MNTHEKPTTSSADCSSAKHQVNHEIYDRRLNGEDPKVLYLSKDLYAELKGEFAKMRVIAEPNPAKWIGCGQIIYMGVEIQEADL